MEPLQSLLPMLNNSNLSLERSDLEHIYSKLPEIDQLNNRSILVTGASGFIGRNIMEFLIHLRNFHKINLQITAITRNITSFKAKFPLLNQIDWINLVESDIANCHYKILQKFDFVIHAACDTNPEVLKNKQLEFIDENYIGTKSILEIVKRSPNCKFLYLSSGATYGTQEESIKHMEEVCLNAPVTNRSDSVYGETKRINELLCALYANKYDINYNIARCYSFVGPYMNFDGHYAIGNFIKNIARGEDIIIKSRNQVFRSYLYSADLVIWLFKILLSGKKGEIYNVGSGRDITISDLALLVKNSLESKSNVVFKDEEIFNTSSSSRYIPSNLKIKNDLKVDEWISLEEAIRKTYNWYLKNIKN